MTLVSIIIPTYNYGHLIAQTLTCLLEQTFQDWEAIIIDDGSTDDTENIIKPFLDSDTRYIYIKQVNKGVSAARNMGLNLSKGDYIQFLDADDLISKDKIKRQVEFLEKNPDIDICLSITWFFGNENPNRLYTDIDLKNKTKMPIINGAGYPIISLFVQHNLTVIHSPLFRRCVVEKIGVFKKEMNYLEDWDFWFRMAISNMRFAFLEDNQSFVLVRVHRDSATQQSNKIIEAEGLLRNFLNKYIQESHLNNILKKELISKNHKLLINTFKTLMACTSFADISKFIQYYSDMNNTIAFISAFAKSINLKRKLNIKVYLI